jgi:hypothetical protein
LGKVSASIFSTEKSQKGLLILDTEREGKGIFRKVRNSLLEETSYRQRRLDFISFAVEIPNFAGEILVYINVFKNVRPAELVVRVKLCVNIYPNLISCIQNVLIFN